MMTELRVKCSCSCSIVDVESNKEENSVRFKCDNCKAEILLLLHNCKAEILLLLHDAAPDELFYKPGLDDNTVR